MASTEQRSGKVAMAVTKTPWQTWILFNVCALAMAILLAFGFVRGLLSPRGLGVALLIWCLAVGSGAALIIKNSAGELALIASPTPINPEIRKLMLRRIRRAKTTIVVLVLALFMALAQIREFPVVALLVGGTLNFLAVAYEVRTIVRLKKILTQDPVL